VLYFHIRLLAVREADDECVNPFGVVDLRRDLEGQQLAAVLHHVNRRTLSVASDLRLTVDSAFGDGDRGGLTGVHDAFTWVAFGSGRHRVGFGPPLSGKVPEPPSGLVSVIVLEVPEVAFESVVTSNVTVVGLRRRPRPCSPGWRSSGDA